MMLLAILVSLLIAVSSVPIEEPEVVPPPAPPAPPAPPESPELSEDLETVAPNPYEEEWSDAYYGFKSEAEIDAYLASLEKWVQDMGEWEQDVANMTDEELMTKIEEEQHLDNNNNVTIDQIKSATENETLSKSAETIEGLKVHYNMMKFLNASDMNNTYSEFKNKMKEFLRDDHELRKNFTEINDHELGDLAREVEFEEEDRQTAKFLEETREELRLNKEKKEGIFGYDMTEQETRIWDDEHSTSEHLKEIAEKRIKAIGDFDEKRKASFLRHEIAAEIAWRVELAKLSDTAQKLQIIAHRDNLRKEREHWMGLHPASRAQLTEIWEKEDGFDQEFNPKTFFYLHDVTNDGYLDSKEIEALFLNQAIRMHDGAIEIDNNNEIKEEIARMREHVLSEHDTDKDGLLSLLEFTTLTLNAEFDTNNGWKPLDAQKEFTERDLRAFIQKNIKSKILDPEMKQVLRGLHHNRPQPSRTPKVNEDDHEATSNLTVVPVADVK